MIDTMGAKSQSVRIKQDYEDQEPLVMKRQKTEDEVNQKG